MTITLEKLGHNFYGMAGMGDCPAGQIDTGDGGGCLPDGSYQVIGPPSLQPNTCPTGLALLSGECVIPGSTVAPSNSGGVNTTPGAGGSLPGYDFPTPATGLSSTTLLVIGGAVILLFGLMISKR